MDAAKGFSGQGKMLHPMLVCVKSNALTIGVMCCYLLACGHLEHVNSEKLDVVPSVLQIIISGICNPDKVFLQI